MPATELAPPELIVYTIFNKQGPLNRAWWHGMTLDAQWEWLQRADPRHFTSPARPLPAAAWSREIRRVRRARERWLREIDNLKQPCRCPNCRDRGRPRFPRYYVVNGISYECWLEQQVHDPEMAELLAPLRNDRHRTGTAFVGRI